MGLSVAYKVAPLAQNSAGRPRHEAFKGRPLTLTRTNPPLLMVPDPPNNRPLRSRGGSAFAAIPWVILQQRALTFCWFAASSRSEFRGKEGDHDVDDHVKPRFLAHGRGGIVTAAHSPPPRARDAGARQSTAWRMPRRRRLRDRGGNPKSRASGTG